MKINHMLVCILLATWYHSMFQVALSTLKLIWLHMHGLVLDVMSWEVNIYGILTWLQQFADTYIVIVYIWEYVHVTIWLIS